MHITKLLHKHVRMADITELGFILVNPLKGTLSFTRLSPFDNVVYQGNCLETI